MKWLVVVALVAVAALASEPASARTDMSSGIAAAGTAGAVPLRESLDPSTFASIADGVVLIRTFTCSGTAKISGSGFLVGERVVMTARHVVNEIGAHRSQCHVKVQASGKWIRVVGISTFRIGRRSNGRLEDLATLKLAEPAPGYTFNFRHSPARVGMNLAMLGHPLGKQVSMTQGPIIARGQVAGVALIAVNLLGAEGSSGSAMVDNNGDVVGILQEGLGSTDILGERTSGVVSGIDLTRAWPNARKQLCRAYPNGGIPDCEKTPPPPPPPSPDFSLTISPSSASVQAGGTADFVVNYIPSGGFNGTINVNISGLPSSISTTWGTPTATGLPLTLRTRSDTPSGSYPFVITGTSGALTRTVNGTLTVLGAPPSPDFRLTLAPSSTSVQAGGTADFVVSYVPSGGFNSAINVNISGLPSSISTTWGTPTGAGLPFTLHTSSNTPSGSYGFVITGTSGALTRTVNGTLTVLGAAPTVTDAWLSTDQAGLTRITSFSGAVATTVYLQIVFQSPTQPHTFQTKWIDPAGQLRLTTTEFVVNVVSGRVWQPVNFPGATMPGTWHGQWFIDGVFARDVPFTVQ